jgi:archaellum component FlaC
MHHIQVLAAQDAYRERQRLAQLDKNYQRLSKVYNVALDDLDEVEDRNDDLVDENNELGREVRRLKQELARLGFNTNRPISVMQELEIEHAVRTALAS